jgi:hypothetical protein
LELPQSLADALREPFRMQSRACQPLRAEQVDERKENSAI